MYAQVHISHTVPVSLTQSSCQVVALTGGGIPDQLSFRSSSGDHKERGGEREGRDNREGERVGREGGEERRGKGKEGEREREEDKESWLVLLH